MYIHLKNFGEKVDQDNAIRIFAQTRNGRKSTQLYFASKWKTVNNSIRNAES